MSEIQIKSALDKIQADITTFHQKSSDEIARTVKGLDSLVRRCDEFDQRLAGVPSGASGGDGDRRAAAREIAQKITESKADFERHGRLKLEVKSTLLSSGLVTPQASPTIGSYGGWGYGNVRQLFASVPAESGSIFQVRETGTTGWNASPQSEGNEKNESVASLTSETLTIQTVAHYITLSKQSFDDVAGLQKFIEQRLLWGLNAEVDAQLISGSGAGNDLKGLTVFASTFDTSLLPSANGYDYAGVIGAAAAQVRIQGFTPNFAILNPEDAYKFRFRKATDGQYVGVPDGLPPIVESMALLPGQFIVGDSRWAVLRPRMIATLDLSESHGSNFTSNLVTVRAEERLAFQPMSYQAFVYGSLTASPA